MDTPLGAAGPVAPGAAPVPRDSPEGEMCLQEMEGSGFPVARHTRVTLLPSFTTMSLEIRNIFGETATRQGERCQGKLLPRDTGVTIRDKTQAWVEGKLQNLL